jgi:hypothetical protein
MDGPRRVSAIDRGGRHAGMRRSAVHKASMPTGKEMERKVGSEVHPQVLDSPGDVTGADYLSEGSLPRLEWQPSQ